MKKPCQDLHGDYHEGCKICWKWRHDPRWQKLRGDPVAPTKSYYPIDHPDYGYNFDGMPATLYEEGKQPVELYKMEEAWKGEGFSVFRSGGLWALQLEDRVLFTDGFTDGKLEFPGYKVVIGHAKSISHSPEVPTKGCGCGGKSKLKSSEAYRKWQERHFKGRSKKTTT